MGSRFSPTGQRESSTYVGGAGEAPMFLFELNRPSLRVVVVVVVVLVLAPPWVSLNSAIKRCPVVAAEG